MACPHDTFESSVVVTERQGTSTEGPTTFYVVALQARCAACQGLLVFDQLPPFMAQVAQLVSQARAGTEVRLTARLAPTDAESPAMTWTAAPTQRPEPPPTPEAPAAD